MALGLLDDHLKHSVTDGAVHGGPVADTKLKEARRHRPPRAPLTPRTTQHIPVLTPLAAAQLPHVPRGRPPCG